MSTLVLEVKFIDGTQSQDIEFNSLESLSIWLRGQCESDFSWLTLHDNNNDYVFDSWDDIFQYINENNGPVLHDLSVCGDACNCMKCNPSKSSISLSERLNSILRSLTILWLLRLNRAI